MDRAERRIDELYTLPPKDFVRARDALVRELKQGGAKTAAARARAIRRPTAATWALNRIARAHPEAVQALARAREKLQKAHRLVLFGGPRGAATQLRAARDEERTATRKILGLVHELLERSGFAATHMEPVRHTLSAAITADPELVERLVAGKLTGGLEPADVEEVLGWEADPGEARAAQKKRRAEEAAEEAVEERERAAEARRKKKEDEKAAHARAKEEARAAKQRSAEAKRAAAAEKREEELEEKREAEKRKRQLAEERREAAAARRAAAQAKAGRRTALDEKRAIARAKAELQRAAAAERKARSAAARLEKAAQRQEALAEKARARAEAAERAAAQARDQVRVAREAVQEAAA